MNMFLISLLMCGKSKTSSLKAMTKIFWRSLGEKAGTSSSPGTDVDTAASDAGSVRLGVPEVGGGCTHLPHPQVASADVFWSRHGFCGSGSGAGRGDGCPPRPVRRRFGGRIWPDSVSEEDHVCYEPWLLALCAQLALLRHAHEHRQHPRRQRPQPPPHHRSRRPVNPDWRRPGPPFRHRVALQARL